MPTILVADDEPSIRRVLKDILTDEGYDVDEAADGDEALAKARSAERPPRQISWAGGPRAGSGGARGGSSSTA